MKKNKNQAKNEKIIKADLKKMFSSLDPFVDSQNPMYDSGPLLRICFITF